MTMMNSRMRLVTLEMRRRREFRKNAVASITLINASEGQINCSIEEFFSAAWSNKSRNILQPKISSALSKPAVPSPIGSVVRREEVAREK